MDLPLKFSIIIYIINIYHYKLLVIIAQTLVWCLREKVNGRKEDDQRWVERVNKVCIMLLISLFIKDIAIFIVASQIERKNDLHLIGKINN